MGVPAIMRAAIILSVVALAAGAPKKLSSKFLSTPMARGGGQIVGGTEAREGEFPHQIALLRGGVGGSLMCGGSLIGPMKVVTAGHCCDGSGELGIRLCRAWLPRCLHPDQLLHRLAQQQLNIHNKHGLPT